MNPETFDRFAASVLVFAAVCGMPRIPIAPTAHAGPTESELNAAAPQTPSSGRSDSATEASPGGSYWDWIEQQHAMP